MTQISTGGPYIAREVHEAALKVKDGIILELFGRIERIEAEVAQLEARMAQRYVCKDGEVTVIKAPAEEPRLKVDTVNNKLVPWSDEMEQFFEPWSKLGLDGEIPMEPGEGYEFLPHGSVAEDGDEYWSITRQKWCESGDRAGVKHIENVENAQNLGPYRRKIKPAPLVLEPSSSARMIWYTQDGVTFRVCPVTGEHIHWTEDLETFFKPWMNLGVMDKVPLVPGEGWEFLPHQSPPEYGDEYWYISIEADSCWNASCERPESFPIHSAPDGNTGPYRRKIKPAPPFKTVPSGTTQTVLVDPKTFLVDSRQAYPLPKCRQCGNDPVWTTHNDLHRIGCSVCPDFGTSPTKSIKQVAEWWTKMCEPVAGESLTISPESAQGCDQASPATPTAAVSANWPVAVADKPFRLEYGKRYVNRVGRVTAPLVKNTIKYWSTHPFYDKSENTCYQENGRWSIEDGDDEEDLIAEYHEPEPPPPAESPDDWVTLTDPDHVARKCDECRCDRIKYDWSPCQGLIGVRIGDVPAWGFRCRRKDLPVVPHLHPNATPPDKQNTRTVTLREYTIDNATVWTSAHWIEGTGRTCQTEVPE